MKPTIVLLLSTDPAIEQQVCEAVTATRHGLRTIQTTPAAFRALQERGDVDAAIIDLDPGIHGTALLEAAGDRLPVIALTSLEREYMLPVASRHGARECLTKPFEAEELRAALERILKVTRAN
jgi:DNA-binding response OmpR family regulator